MRSSRYFPGSQKYRQPAAGGHWAWFAAVAVVFFLALSPAPRAQQDQAVNEAQETATEQPASRLYQSLTQSFGEAMVVEKQELNRVSTALESLQAEAEEMKERMSRIQLMESTYSNLLLLPSVDARKLEQAKSRQNVAVGYIQEQLKNIKDEIGKWEKALEETREQVASYTDQRTELKTRPPQVALSSELAERLDALIGLLETKQAKIEQILEIYKDQQQRLSRLVERIRPLGDKIDEQIEARKKSRILQHDPSPMLRLARGELRTNLGQSLETLRTLIFETAWTKTGIVTWEEYSLFLGVFLFLLAVLQAILYVCTRFCGSRMQKSLDDERFWHYVLLKLFQKSLPWAGAMAYLYFFPIRPIYQLTPVFSLLPLIIRLLALILVVRWGRIFLKALGGQTADPLFHRIYSPLRRLLAGFLLYGIGYLFFSRLICTNCMTLIAWRLIFEFLLLGWCIYFFHVFRRSTVGSEFSEHPWFPLLKPVLIAMGYGLVLPGLLAELMGFGGLAVYWYFGLAKTALLLFWVFILYRVLRESDVAAHIERSDDVDIDELSARPYPVRWLIVRLLRIGVLAAALFSFFVAWGAPRTFLVDILYAINYEVTVGDFRLSLMGFVYALIVLLFVHTFTVIFKEFLRGRVLKDADMEPGLKDSILRITGYVLWMVGILIALRTVGISATALTVVFGALGIGLGFGLQNIFNNFLSGIILLFERPIQVGDVIEMGTIWGTVREINVRSTQVRTFDNAELIIPNSDLISQVVTNWSFRDARVRRTVEVRVAYGSDVALVREVLMDVAYQHPRILRRPHPEVLFSDFGDSALVFKLRFWVHIDWFLTVETDVRSDIDKQFKEHGITIPFPQQDVYLKTGKLEPPEKAGAQEQNET
ncbi:small-conductance mechanosensitive channel/predicted nucleic acid-binding Zn-ribbon protein [Desulfosalsimonas propionicica]|uniref:Small-conductance mechanosensitive channel/predicted nucleic acid-binding Zn-ribbon protein n=1 Tax=Desulfosalsimonas propionicica TaxID=332175 RepID=A0A7W0CC54_9BACT|nr:mechanosensitive ion channel domain-containing protein [Desulfosalsimonas propionicica]MBA2882954.1 small-conductance mechanosensitive channel/predicted nucleic acid-binding Zn-ribbon protein [Desulfosalsimonas propionicica]